MNGLVVWRNGLELLEYVGELFRSAVFASLGRNRIHALPVRHRPRVGVLREQPVNERGACAHPTDQEDRRRDLGIENFRRLANRLLDQQVLPGHAEAIHLRGNPTREAQLSVFSH